jgi:hypothetical protein
LDFEQDLERDRDCERLEELKLDIDDKDFLLGSAGGSFIFLESGSKNIRIHLQVNIFT